MLPEVVCENSQQFRMSWWISRTKVIHRIYNSSSKEVAPDAIHDRFGKVRISSRRHPFCKTQPRISPIAVRESRTIKERWLNILLRSGMNKLQPSSQLPMSPRIVDQDEIDLVSKSCETAKKRRHAPVLVLTPSFVRMVVTLGAIQPSTEKDANLFSHDVLRVPKLIH